MCISLESKSQLYMDIEINNMLYTDSGQFYNFLNHQYFSTFSTFISLTKSSKDK